MKPAALLLAVLATATACSGTAQKSTKASSSPASAATKRITLPSPLPRSFDFSAATWSVKRGADWTHVQASSGNDAADFYLHRGIVYELRHAISVAYKRRFDYLLTADPTTSREVVAHVSSADSAALQDAPDPGLAVVHANEQDPSSMLDFTYSKNGSIHQLTDTPGPKLVDVYEHDCLGCTMEGSVVVAAARDLRRNAGRTFMISSGTLQALERDLGDVSGRSLTVPVHDRALSIYSVIGVHTLPLNYFITSNNKIAVAESGSLLYSWVKEDLKHISVR